MFITIFFLLLLQSLPKIPTVPPDTLYILSIWQTMSRAHTHTHTWHFVLI